MTRPRLRTTASVALAVLGCLLAIVSLVAVWGRNQVLDTDKYLSSVVPMADDPVIQDEVSTKVAAAINARLDGAALAQSVLPTRAAFLAAPIGEAVQQMVDNRTEQFVHSDAFAKIWRELNLRTHRQIVALLTDDDTGAVILNAGKVSIDLSPVVEEVRLRLVQAGLSVVASIPPITLVVDVADAEGLEQARTAVTWLDRLANWLPWISLAVLGGAAFAARRRLPAAALLAAGVLWSMVLARGLIAYGAHATAQSVPTRVASKEATRAYYDHVTSLLRDGAVTVGVVALVLGLVFLGVRALRTGGALSPGAAVLVGAGAALLLWTSPGVGGVVLVLVLAVAAYVALRQWLPRPAEVTAAPR